MKAKGTRMQAVTFAEYFTKVARVEKTNECKVVATGLRIEKGEESK